MICQDRLGTELQEKLPKRRERKLFCLSRTASRPSTSLGPPGDHLRKQKSFLSGFPMCLSRACLGKTIAVIYKWLKTTDFAAYQSSIYIPLTLSFPSPSLRPSMNSSTIHLCHTDRPHRCVYTIQCITAQHSTAQHSTGQRSAAQRSAAQHSTGQRSAAQHSTSTSTALRPGGGASYFRSEALR
jgi:hypothetical protein